jgi:AbrB family looped-hinge helix DNA binding protein
MKRKQDRELPRVIPTKITKGGQITLPAEARAELGVKQGDTVDVCIQDGEVRVVKPKYTLKDVLGKLPPPRPGYIIEKAVREAREEMAEEKFRRMRAGRE